MKLKDGFYGSREIDLPQSIIKELEQDIIGCDLHITNIGYYPAAKYHFRRRTQGIDQYVLLYCVSGQGWYEIDGNLSKLTANQFCIIPTNLPHAYGAENKNPWTIYWIHFKGNKASFFAKNFDIPTTINPYNNSRIEDRIEMFEELYRILELGYGKENLHYCITCFYHFLGSLTYISQFREVKNSTEKGTDVVETAIHFMRENIDKKLTLNEIAAYLKYSPSHFSCIFNKKTGYSPLNYYTHLKIQKACELLKFSDMKINQICPKLGFEDTFYFSRVFGKVMGMSPSQFRERENKLIVSSDY